MAELGVGVAEWREGRGWGGNEVSAVTHRRGDLPGGRGDGASSLAFLPPYPCTTVMYRIPCVQYESSCRELRMQSEQATSEASQMRRMLAAKDEELATACGCGGGGMWIYVWGACGCGGTQM